MKQLLVFFSTFTLVQFATAQDKNALQKKWLVQGGDTLPYNILLPVNFDSTKTYPIVFFLHGAGERGRDNEKQLIHGSKLFLNDAVREKYPAIVVFPQCTTSSYWGNVLRIHDSKNKRSFHFLTDGEPTLYMRLLMQLVQYSLHTYNVQKNRVYVGGLSMGGMGTFELVRRMPNTFAAAFPICGGANPATAKQLAATNWWVFHGGKDDVVLPMYSEKMVAALQAVKAKVQFTIYPNANHNSWDAAFAEPNLLPWLFSCTMKVKN
jgi:predicted peptidase